MNILAAKSGKVPEINHRRVTKYKIATKCSSVIQYTVSIHTVDTIDTGDCNDHINWGQSATVELFCHTGRRDGGMAPMTNAGYLLPCRGQGVYVDTAVGGRCVISYYHGLTAGHCTDQQPGSHRCATPWPMQICLANCGVGVRCPGRGLWLAGGGVQDNKITSFHRAEPSLAETGDSGCLELVCQQLGRGS